MDINAEIELLRRKMQMVKSHIAKIELQRKIVELESKRKDVAEREPWEMG